MIVHFVWWTLMAMWATISSHKFSWPCSVGMCPRQLLCVHIHAILCAQSSRCDRPNLCHQVTLVSPCMRHTSICLMLWRALAHPSMSMLAHIVYTGVKPCRWAIVHQTQNLAGFSPWKWGIPIAVFSQRKLAKDSVLCAMTPLRWSAAEFSSRK